MSNNLKKISVIVLCVAVIVAVGVMLFLKQSGSVDDSNNNIEKSENSFGEFIAKTFTGEEISNDVFADYDLTMVNLWASFCKPCIEEMAELEELYKGLSENLNLITICYDADTQSEIAKQILEAKGATFDTIIADDTLRKTVLKDYMAFPTTVFVDSDGNIVGDFILGRPSSNIVETYMQEIDNRLELIGE